MNVTCVKCTSVLDKAKVGDVEVDLCPACGGLWLDYGEIERIGKGPQESVASLRARLTGGKPEPVSETSTACPACPGQLKVVTLGPIQVEWCTRCRGLFLDKGELDAALSTVKGTSVQQLLAAAGAAATAAQK